MGKNLTFGEAVAQLKNGSLIRRSGWNGKGMFLFVRPEATVEVEIVKTLPDAVKDYYREKGLKDVVFTGYICMKAADESIVNGWLASQTDVLATDWEIL